MGSNAAITAWVLFGAAATSALYAAILERIHNLYTPDWTWLTVVGGNALIGGFLALWLWLDPLAGGVFAAFWRLLALNLAAGLPIIAWQIGQRSARLHTRRPRNGGNGGHSDQDQGRPGGY